MNGTYYPNPTFPSNMNNFTPDQEVSTNTMPMEQSYIENILRLNKGKKLKYSVLFQILMNGEIEYMMELLNNQEKII